MRRFAVCVALACAAVACGSEDAPVPPNDASQTDTSSAVVRAIYEGDLDAFLSLYPAAERDFISPAAGPYLERYQPFGPATVREVSAVTLDNGGVNVTVSYRIAVDISCQTYVFFRSATSPEPALYPLSPTSEGCIGAWGGRGE